MANLKQTSITGSSGTTTLLVSGSSIVMPSMSGSVDSGSAAQMYIDVTPTAGLTMKLTQAGSFGSQNSPYTCLGAWSVGGNLINPRTSTSGTGFSNDSLLTAGGNDGSAMNETEEYNGSTWAAGGNLSVARWTSLTGTQNAAMAGGGATPTRLKCSEQYNGISWSDGGAMHYCHADGAFAGSPQAAVYFGGYIGGPSLGTCTEFFNEGLGWTNGPAVPSNSFGGQAQGTSTATTLLLGGTTPSAPAYGATTCAIDFDGTTYNAITSTLFCHAVGAGYGQSSDNMGVVGGCTHGSSGCKTEEWHGVSWTLLPDLPVANRYIGGGGNINGSGAGVFGGGPVESATYNFTKIITNPFTYNAAVTSDAWSGKANMITARAYGFGGGSSNAAWSSGGNTPAGAYSNTTEIYNGSSWSVGNTMLQARNEGPAGNAGTATAGLAVAGYKPPNTTCTEEWDGTNWSAGGAKIIAVRGNATTGTQDAAIDTTGYANSPSSATENYNGTSWSTSTAAPAATYGGAMTGTQNDAFFYLGQGQTSAVGWDGTSWSTKATGLTLLYTAGIGGTANDNIQFGGSPALTNNHSWNGTTVVTSVPLLQGRRSLGSTGANGTNTSSNNSLAIGGCAAPGGAYYPYVSLFSCLQNVCSTTPFCLATWSGGDPLTIARFGIAGAGTQNAGLAAGGYISAVSTCTEEYNGTSWSPGGALNTARYMVRGAGTQNAGLAFGGYPLSPAGRCTEEYDGSSWTTVNPIITTRANFAGNGETQDAAYMAGGQTPTVVTCHEQYNGTTWSTSTAIITARRFLTGTGTPTAGIIFGGYSPASPTATEEWNGGSWSTMNSMSTGRDRFDGTGTAFDSLATGGYSNKTDVESWNGIVWSNAPSMMVGRGDTGDIGTANAAIVAGGRTPTKVSCTELFTCADYQVGTWSGEAPLITSRDSGAGAGVANASLAFGGNDPVITTTEEWNGESWSVGGALIVGARYMGGTGLQDAALKAAGYNGSSYINNTEEYDGTSWTAGPTTIISKATMGLTGIQNAAVMFGGEPSQNTTEEYNGSAWSAGNTMITAVVGNSGVGTQNSSLSIGGYTPTVVATVEQYNGTTWSSSVALNIARKYATAFGTSNSAINAGGSNNASCPSTEEWNGLGWTSRANIAVAKSNLKSSQNSLSSEGIIFAGSPGGRTNSRWSVSNPVNQGIYCLTKTL